MSVVDSTGQRKVLRRRLARIYYSSGELTEGARKVGVGGISMASIG